jgi:hypothetical protein
LVLIPAYQVFGGNVLYYNLSALLFRLLATLSFWWVLQQLWTRKPTANALAALLFFVYPGFLSQFNGIDYQSQLVSLAAAMLSIALSLKALSTSRFIFRVLFFIPAGILGWFYLGLVEYFLGFELFRLAIFMLLQSRFDQTGLAKVVAGIRSWLPNILIPGVFLIWRVFFFESERGATDIGAQLAVFQESPLATGVWWALRLALNSLDVLFSAWVIPLYQLSGEFSRLREVFIAGLASLMVIAPVLWLIQRDDNKQVSNGSAWQTEMFWLGIALAVAGLIPVILVNRAVDFSNFTRYALASSIGSALVFTAVLFMVSAPPVRAAGVALLLFSAVFTHHANALKLARETASLREFWWQVTWRIPMLEADTALIANYPVGSIQEDYFVWGPANLIYYPTFSEPDRIRVSLTAIVLNKDSVLTILSDASQGYGDRRSIQTLVNYNQILILSRPSVSSCVQVIDGHQPVFSEFEEERVMLVAPSSDVDTIVVGANSVIPPQLIFGDMPEPTWCFYYEKASLAVQQGNWTQALELGNDAFKLDLAAGDPIEWLPFLRAYARAGDVDRLREIKRLMRNSSPYVFDQTCSVLMRETDLPAGVLETVSTLYCQE